jgi:hypothetical protein
VGALGARPAEQGHAVQVADTDRHQQHDCRDE